MWTRCLLVLTLLFSIVAIPLALQTGETSEKQTEQRQLKILTPHNETIRREFGEAFTRYYKEETGEQIYVNWLTPGGTSEIRRVLDSGFAAAHVLSKEGPGIDVFFGGGDYIFQKQAEMKPSRLVELEVFRTRAELFQEGNIPSSFTGETYYDVDRKWVGLCLSQFGICYNDDTLKRLNLSPPTEWRDLTAPSYHGQIALADPTKSGSVAKAFEMLLQQELQLASTPEEGWRRGMNVIKKIAANARYFTDSATKIPQDVAQGDSAAGFCVDFYGKTLSERLRAADGRSRLQWTAPEGGTSVSVDPVAILAGADEVELAQEFVNFCLSKEGQLLWINRRGSGIGPKHRPLRRFPIRRDLYSEENVKAFSDTEDLPYSRKQQFIYKPELTARGFGALRLAIRVMCIDPHHELKEAYLSRPSGHALDIFEDIEPLTYEYVMGELPVILEEKSALEVAQLTSQLSEEFRNRYLQVVQKGKGSE